MIAVIQQNQLFLNMTDQFQPFLIRKYCRKRGIIPKKRTLQENSNNKNSWTVKEHMDYVRFFMEHMNFWENNLLRKSERIFIKMTDYIRTRKIVQIKSHHQKLLLKYGSINNIVLKLYEKIREYKESKSEAALELKPKSSVMEGQNLEKTQTDIRLQQFENVEAEQERYKSTIVQGLGDLQLFDVLSWPQTDSQQIDYF